MIVLGIFIFCFIVCAVILKTVVNSFMGLMGAGMYSFSIRTRVSICIVGAMFLTALLTGMI